MRDQLLFAVAPRVAVISSAIALIVQCARVIAARADVEPAADTSDAQPGRVTAAWRFSMAIIALGHLLAFASPSAILLWDRQMLRLIVLESIGWLAGAVALGSFVVKMWRRQRSSANRTGFSPLDVITATIFLLALTSGLVSAVVYRWASYWSAVTLTPYVHSLFQWHASFALVSSMPALVKLHVLCAFAVVTLMPWTVEAREELEAVWSAWQVRAHTRLPAWQPAGIVLAGSREPALSVGEAEMSPARGNEEFPGPPGEEV